MIADETLRGYQSGSSLLCWQWVAGGRASANPGMQPSFFKKDCKEPVNRALSWIEQNWFRPCLPLLCIDLADAIDART